MKKLFVIIQFIFISLIPIACSDDDSACDRAEEKAKSKCQSGYEARNCRVSEREKDVFGKTSTCEVTCQCYKKSSRSSDFKEVTGSCTLDEEGNVMDVSTDSDDDVDSGAEDLEISVIDE